MSEVSFGNIELPLEQEKFFFFNFISVDASAFVSAQLYMNVTVIMHEVIQSIITYSRWSWVSSDVPNVDVDDITHVQAAMIRERIKEKFCNKWSYLFICCMPFSNNLSSKKANTACSFPAQTFLCCYSGSSASGSGSTDCTTSFSTNSSRSVQSDIIASP